ncbi:DUF6436 domain-containing protein [Saccharospirillum impatiens]|uniref:DUF6436 domain-containing protein n=1 Tax=Saccharospirillum impatiens TaxID=169438 RepID=UPI000417C63A|nr:DUF6436 domain-containing protein [Saccharospirillum impatiens]
MSRLTPKTALLGVLVIVWIVAIVTGFWWFQARLIVTFDADQSILNQYPRVRDYGEALHRALPATVPDNKARVTIVRHPGCRCNRYSAEHLAALEGRYDVSTRFASARLNDLPAAMQALIPATPFVMVHRSDGSLVYAGPVNSGVTCTSTSSFLDTKLSSPGDPTLHIPLLARGCYCANPVSAPL